MNQITNSTPSKNVDSSFVLLRSQHIESLNITFEEYEHTATGASHIHLAADNDENVFLVALRTVPHDSSGVAHILEHTALCGSEKYPVRDPFFMMIRRSINTFMNAFTSSDWTAYPFASQNKKDFDNLLDVYLDAVFFSRLDPLDFAQEGHRIEFEETNNPDSDLVYKGVVFNEMKGAMSSVSSQLWQTLCKYLYPTTTYHYNSGGDPESITDLTYEQLKHFYKTHYHPSNAIFMTYGSISAEDHQQKFEDQALKKFKKLDEKIFVPAEKRYQAPLRVEEFYPYNNEESETGIISDKTHIVMGWLLGKTTHLIEALEAQLLASVLFDNSASPLLHALETTELGSAPSPLCGLDDSQYELTFVCGIEGSENEKADDFEKFVLNTLDNVATQGIPLKDVEACLHQLELQQREIGGDGYPYGLQLILNALTAATHRGDPVGLLDIDPALSHLREKIKDPNYIKNLVKKLLLDNQHRVRLVMKPDTKLAQRKKEAEAQQLSEIKSTLSDSDKQQVILLANDLQKRQEQKDDMSILPKVDLDDVPHKIRYTKRNFSQANDLPVSSYSAGTNGLVYQQAIIDIPSLTEEELKIIPLYTACLTELGIGNNDYLETQKIQSQTVGSLNAFSSIRPHVNDPQKSQGHIILSAKALADNHSKMTQLMGDSLHKVSFKEHARIRELIAQIRARRESSVTGNGHGLAMSAASSAICPVSKLNHELSGLAGISMIKQLDDSLNNQSSLKNLAHLFEGVHQKVMQQPLQFLLVGENHSIEQQQKSLTKLWQQYEKHLPAKLNAGTIVLPKSDSNCIKQAWITGTQVNFCAKAFPTVPTTHVDSAALTVLGGFLRNGFLHRTIREQGGAYGGGAQQDNSIGAFRFYSYRDPRLAETLNDFEKSIEWLMETQHEWAPVEEAILGVVSSIDKPASPAGEAKQTFHAELNGRTLEIREAFRNNVLNVTANDLQRVAKTYLLDKKNENIAIITSKDNSTTAESLGLTTINL
ncbi:MAG: insulinase family protein [Cellvibrionaceae bacterium]